MNEKIQAKDLISLGLFTVLYFVLGCCVAIPIGFVPVFLPVLGALWTLITGIPFMLYAVRVKKFGLVTIMAILSGLLMGLTGMGYWGILTGAVFGLLGDLILKSGEYRSAKKTILGYGVFSLWMVGTYIPMYFIVEQSRADFAASFGEEVCRQGHVRHADVEPDPRRRGYLRLCDPRRSARQGRAQEALCEGRYRLIIMRSFHPSANSLRRSAARGIRRNRRRGR